MRLLDRYYGAAVARILAKWGIPNKCITAFLGVLCSNNYIQRLTERFNLLDFCLGSPGVDKTKLFEGKGLADVFEIHSLLVFRVFDLLFAHLCV